MKYKADNLFLYVEGMQFRNGEYSTTDKDKIAILKRYSDITIVEEKPEVSDVKTDVKGEASKVPETPEVIVPTEETISTKTK